ncbi:MAG TPA: hypothetical protein VGN37_11590 [Actinocatenispora sp.]
MRRDGVARTGLAAFAALVAIGVLAGCVSSADGAARGAGAGAGPTAAGAIASPTTPYETPTPTASPGDDASARDQILFELQSRVLAEAGTPGVVSGSCDAAIPGSRDQQVTCTVRYEDLRVDFAVRVRGGRMVFGFTATQRRAPITRAGVVAAFARYAYGLDPGAATPEPGSVHCDESLPERALVGYDTPTRYACAYRVGGTEPVRARVRVTEHGPLFADTVRTTD